MKIAIVADHVGPDPAARAAPGDLYPGDPALRVLSLATALAGLGQQVSVYSRKDTARQRNRGAAPTGVSIERVAAGPPERLTGADLLLHVAAFAASLAERWRRSAPDVVHAQSLTSALAALPGARRLGIPVVLSFGPAEPMPDRPDGRQAERQPARQRPVNGAAASARLPGAIGSSADAVLAASDAVLAASDAVLAGSSADAVLAASDAVLAASDAVLAGSSADAVLAGSDAVLAGSSAELAAAARLGVPPSSVRVVPPGVDTARFRPSGPAAKRGERPRLLMIGDLADRQAMAVALRALASVPTAELVIAGGPARAKLAGDSGYRDLARLAGQLGVQDRLTCTGALSHGDAPNLMRSADVLISMAAAEPFDIVPLDAMACGVPVVATAAGLQKDAVINATTGFLVPPDHPAMLARRLRCLLAYPMLREGYGIAAACRARDRYSWDRIGQEVLASYQRLPRLAPPTEASQTEPRPIGPPQTEPGPTEPSPTEPAWAQEIPA
jgi:glycosyltransferase involved in cell wall biosynthesis